MHKEPQIVIPDLAGINNNNQDATRKRLTTSKSYQDLSTICIMPCVGGIPPKVVQSLRGLLTPMNQKFILIMVENMEVGAAYSATIEQILMNPDLSNWKYILTMETDNLPPPDGLLKAYENMDKYDAIGGLYFTKGELGQPMCYGDPNVFPVNFIPFLPQVNEVAECRGLGMGFTLFKMEMFKNQNIPRPLFQTVQDYTPGVGARAYTQDLKFFEEAGKQGFKFACDSRIKVGHYDYLNDFTW
jgi:hypothetical protein